MALLSAFQTYLLVVTSLIILVTIHDESSCPLYPLLVASANIFVDEGVVAATTKAKRKRKGKMTKKSTASPGTVQTQLDSENNNGPNSITIQQAIPSVDTRSGNSNDDLPIPDIQIFRVVSEFTTFVQATTIPANRASLQGSQFILNGAVHNQADVRVINDEIVGSIPDPVQGSFYNQQCTVMDGISSSSLQIVTQNMCHYNFCVAEFGCLFMRSGGAFLFDLTDPSVDAVPRASAAILGGTGFYGGYRGWATIEVLSRSFDDNGNQQRSVLEIELIATE